VRKLGFFLKYWLPVVLWMAVIFTGSSDSHSYEHSSLFVEPLLRWLFPQMTQEHIETIHLYIRKCGHLAEYAVLALLLWRALRRPVKNDSRPWVWREAQLALGIVMLYAATDEFHQIFVPERTGLLSDVFIDTAGGAVGLLALRVYDIFRKSKR